jgi:hypothetical protein
MKTLNEVINDLEFEKVYNTGEWRTDDDDALHHLKEYQKRMKTWTEKFSGVSSAESKICNLVDIDDVLDLFGCSDEDIYAKSIIEDALYDGTLKLLNEQKSASHPTSFLNCRCGGEASYYDDRYRGYCGVQCTKCGIDMSNCESREEAIRKWNTVMK